MCKGCKKEIEYSQKCIRNKYKTSPVYHESWWTVDQYHCEVLCIAGGMAAEDILSFCAKPWADRYVRRVVKEIEDIEEEEE